MNDAASPFAARTVAILVVLGVLLGLGSLLLSGFGEDLSRVVGDRPGPDAKHGAGYNAFRRVAAAVNGAAEPAADPADTPGLLILTPSEKTRPEDVKAIVDARRQRAEAAVIVDEATDGPPPRFATLVILPKWQVQAQPLRQDRVRRTGIVSSEIRTAFVPIAVDPHQEERGDIASSRDVRGLTAFAVPEQVLAIAGERARPWIGARDGAAVLAQIDGDDLFVLADPDLVNNRAMADGRNALAGVAMLRAIDPEGGGRAAFDVSLHYRPGERNLVRLLFTPPFLAVTVALIAAALLAGIAAANRFGPVLREGRTLALGKRALLDNIAALTRLAGRTASAGPRYADAMVEAVSRRLGIGGTRDERVAALDRLRPGYAAIDAALIDARTERAALTAAQDLHEWRKEAGA